MSFSLHSNIFVHKLSPNKKNHVTSLCLPDESLSLLDKVGLATISVWVLFPVMEHVIMLLTRRGLDTKGPAFVLLKPGWNFQTSSQSNRGSINNLDQSYQTVWLLVNKVNIRWDEMHCGWSTVSGCRIWARGSGCEDQTWFS